MTDKEFKRLRRSQLIEIIYQLQLQEDELIEENRKLKAALEDRRIRMEKAGSIAEAAIQLNDVMQSTQSAAEQYLKEIELMYEEMHENVEKERQRIVERTKKEAVAYLAHAKRVRREQKSSGMRKKVK